MEEYKGNEAMQGKTDDTNINGRIGGDGNASQDYFGGENDPANLQINGQQLAQQPVQVGQQFTQQPMQVGQQFTQQPMQVGQQFTQQPMQVGQQFAQQPMQGGQQFTQQPMQGGQQFTQQPMQGGQQFTQQPVQVGQQFTQQPMQVGQQLTQQPVQGGQQLAQQPMQVGQQFTQQPIQQPNTIGAIYDLVGSEMNGAASNQQQSNSEQPTQSPYEYNRPASRPTQSLPDRYVSDYKRSRRRKKIVVWAVLLAIVATAVIFIPPEYKLLFAVRNTLNSRSLTADISVPGVGELEMEYNKRQGMEIGIRGSETGIQVFKIFVTYDKNNWYLTTLGKSIAIDKDDIEKYTEDPEDELYNSLLDLIETSGYADDVDEKKLKRAVKKIISPLYICKYTEAEKDGENYNIEISVKDFCVFACETILTACSGELADVVEDAMREADEYDDSDITVSAVVKRMKLSSLEIEVGGVTLMEMEFHGYGKTKVEIPDDVKKSIENAEEIDLDNFAKDFLK